MPEAETLTEVVERVRADEFPDLQAELVEAVLEAQIEHSADPQKARQESERVLRQWLASRDKAQRP